MTCREKLTIEHPESVGKDHEGGCRACPSTYGYLENPDDCCKLRCRDCWDREIPETPHIKDSGARREFETGAVRDIQEGKGRCDLMPLDIIDEYLSWGDSDYLLTDDDTPLTLLEGFGRTGSAFWLYSALHTFAIRSFASDHYTMMLELAKHFEEGAKKYGENNWQKGIPVHCYIDSAVRHYLKHMRGDTDEPHHRAFCWNIVCAIWTCKNKPELNEYKKEEN